MHNGIPSQSIGPDYLYLIINHHFGKNSTPHDLDPVQFYKDYIKAFKSYFDNPLLFQMQDLNLKIICWKLIENDTSMPNEFLRQKDIDFQASLSNIHNKINRPYARRLSWQI